MTVDERYGVSLEQNLEAQERIETMFTSRYYINHVTTFGLYAHYVDFRLYSSNNVHIDVTYRIYNDTWANFEIWYKGLCECRKDRIILDEIFNILDNTPYVERKGQISLF